MEEQRIDALDMRGGKLVLDFLNTVGWHGSTHPSEWLHTYQDLARWSWRAGILSEQQCMDTLVQAQQRSEEAKRVYEEAIQLREAFFRLFLTLTQGVDVNESDLAFFNKMHARMAVQQQLVVERQSFHLDWVKEGHQLEALLWPIIVSAVELLTSEQRDRIHLCAAMDCGWFFYDQSKNKSRKWCASQECGNRDRVRRHYQQSRVRV